MEVYTRVTAGWLQYSVYNITYYISVS